MIAPAMIKAISTTYTIPEYEIPIFLSSNILVRYAKLTPAKTRPKKETECSHSSIVSRLLNSHNQISFIADNSDKSKNFVQKSFLYVTDSCIQDKSYVHALNTCV